MNVASNSPLGLAPGGGTQVIKPAHKGSHPSKLVSWLRRHMRTVSLNYHILIIFLLLTGAIVTAGIMVVKEVRSVFVSYDIEERASTCEPFSYRAVQIQPAWLHRGLCH